MATEERAKQLHYEQKSAGYSASGRRGERLLRLVGGPNLRVLDVACGPGHIGKLLRERGNRVVGAEISEAAASVARGVLDEVHVFDIEGEWPSALADGSFDVVVLGEVLEHVFDPVSVLRQARRVLGPRGRVVITTPNFLVWVARLQVLFGRFRYQKYGIFDFGHIRFFTYPYLKEVLKESGFELKAQDHVHYPARLERYVRTWPNLFALNFVVEASKVEERTPA